MPQTVGSEIKNGQYSNFSLKRICISHTFAICFSLAIQAVFITGLMVQYAMESIIGCFIWTIPYIFSTIIKPYASKYIEKRNKGLHTYVNNSLVFLIVLGIGNLLVMFSSSPQTLFDQKHWWFYHFLRIIISSVGWTLVGVSENFIRSNIQKFKEIAGDDSFQKQIELVTLISEIIAYILSLDVLRREASWVNFHAVIKIIYLTAALISFTVALFTLFQRKIIQNLKSVNIITSVYNIFKSTQEVNMSISSFFPGIICLNRVSSQLWSHLICIFCEGYIIDVVVIYLCMWFAWASAKHEDNLTPSMFIVGFKLTAVFLSLYSLNGFFLKRYCRKLGTQLLGLYMIISVIANIISVILVMIEINVFVIGCMVLMVSVLKSIHEVYYQQLFPSLVSGMDDYESVCQFVSFLQKMFVVSTMPFFCVMVLNVDDTDKCLYFSLIALIILAVLIGQRLYKSRSLQNTKQKQQ